MGPKFKLHQDVYHTQEYFAGRIVSIRPGKVGKTKTGETFYKLALYDGDTTDFKTVKSSKPGVLKPMKIWVPEVNLVDRSEAPKRKPKTRWSWIRRLLFK